MSVYRPEFEAALRLFARASRMMADAGFAPPILVGGAAVEFYTAGAVATGDLDIVTPRQEVFEQILLELGFTKPEGLGHTSLGWVHPKLGLGFEVVSSTLLDGMADRNRVAFYDFNPDGTAAFVAVEDIIADRMGQYASGTAPEMLYQALILLAISDDIDQDYMDERIRYETGGDYGAADVQP